MLKDISSELKNEEIDTTYNLIDAIGSNSISFK
jgi:hypothetical protein